MQFDFKYPQFDITIKNQQHNYTRA